jgi:hypothetical protein
VSSCTSSEVSDFLSTDIVTKDLEAVVKTDESQQQPNSEFKIDDDESDKMMIMINDSILPTHPDLSGSMDSLSSHSASSNSSSSPSFTTFGKESKIVKESDSTHGKTSIIFIEDDLLKSVEPIDTRKMVVGSSDEDSGFENVQIKCEAK